MQYARAYRNGLAITDGATLIEGYMAAFGMLGLARWRSDVAVSNSGYGRSGARVDAGQRSNGQRVMVLLTAPATASNLHCSIAHPVVFMSCIASATGCTRGAGFCIPVSVQVFEWSRIRAMIVPFKTVGGGGAMRTNYGLRLVQTDIPNGTQIVASFGVGVPSAYDGGSEPAALWEHLRRFMQEGGPHLGAHDALYVDDSSPSRLWNALWWWQPLLGPGSKQFWIGPYWFLTIPFGLFTLPCLPLTMAGGFIRWLSYCCKRPAPWPPEVLASIGRRLSRENWRGPSGSVTRITRPLIQPKSWVINVCGA